MEKQFKEEVETEVKKSKKTETIFAFIILAIFGICAMAGSWYYLATQPGENYQSILKFKKTTKTDTKSTATTDETANWKQVAGDCGYTIKYPDTWVTKVYPGTVSTIAFADTAENLPKDQTDMMPPIGAHCESSDLADTITSSVEKIRKDTITINGVTAKKWTLLPGRADEMYGDVKFVYISVPTAGGKYVYLVDYNDRFTTIYDDMAKSIRLTN